MTTTRTTPVQLDITPLSGTIGAEIRNVDLHRPLGPEVVAAIRQALLDYKVIFFPGQHLSPAEHKHFATYFGEITNAHPVIPGIDEHKEVFEIDYTQTRQMPRSVRRASTASGTSGTPTSPSSRRRRSGRSSTPSSSPRPVATPCGPTPTPPTRACRSLSKDLVDGLTAVHDGTHAFGKLLELVGRGGMGRPGVHRAGARRAPGGADPPRDRPAQPLRQSRLHHQDQGLDRQGERHPFGFLYTHMATPEYVVRYRWEAGDLGFWDNRTTMHYAIGDYGDAHRVIQRVTIKGDKPF